MLCAALLHLLWAPLVEAAAPPGLPGTEISPADMEKAFPKPLQRSAPNMPFSPGPAPLLPEAAPMRVPEPQRPAPAAPQAPVLRQPQGKGINAPKEASSGRVSTDASRASDAPATKNAGAASGSAAANPDPLQADTPPTVEMMAGQMLMVGFSGAELKNNAPVLDLAARGIIGGLILLPHDALGPRNITSPAQVRVLTATVQKAAREGKGGVPLFLAVEQEGGMAQALNPKMGFEGGAAAARLGRGSTEGTATAAKRMGLEMAALGLNFNFAPVADANVNPLNEDIGKAFRSFSPDPAQAAAHALAFGRGMAAAGIIPCLKYFPGTGSHVTGGFAPASGEAHFGPPDLAGTWQTLELTPFREVLRQNWPGVVQPALAYHRGLDALYPATLSARMLTGILREQWHFSGVIVSNDLEALGRFYPLEEALLLAVRAGADILLLPARQGIAPAAGQAPGIPGLPNLPGLDELADISRFSGAGGLAGLLTAGGLVRDGKNSAPERTGLVSDAVLRAHTALVQMVRDGRIPQERLRLSWQRIMKLKKTFLYSEYPHIPTP